MYSKMLKTYNPPKQRDDEIFRLHQALQQQLEINAELQNTLSKYLNTDA